MPCRVPWLAIATVALVLLAPLPALAGDGDAVCATAMTPVRTAPLQLSRPMLEAARTSALAPLQSGFEIVLVPGAGLAANPAALAVDGQSKLTIRGKGAQLAPPDPALTPPVTVQLIGSDGTSTRCWQTTFSSGVSRNDDEQFKARGP